MYAKVYSLLVLCLVLPSSADLVDLCNDATVKNDVIERVASIKDLGITQVHMSKAVKVLTNKNITACKSFTTVTSLTDKRDLSLIYYINDIDKDVLLVRYRPY